MRPAAVIGLTALVQALTEVRRLAGQGQWQESRVVPLLDSLFAFDSESAEAVYGGLPALAPGLTRLVALLSGSDRDGELLRMLQTVLRLERQLARRPEVGRAIAADLADTERAVNTLGRLHDTVIERLAGVYGAHLSTLKPRVMVTGEPVLLQQPRVVCRIRALLLTAVRAAVLWRQSGGSRFGLLLRNKSIREQARAMLAGEPNTEDGGRP